MAVVLGVVAFALAIATTEWDFVAVLALYVVTTIAYSFWLKHVAILDLVIVASGFLLRHRWRGRRERGGVELVPHRHRLRLAVRRHRQAPRRTGGAGGGGAQRPSDPRPLHRPVPALRHGRRLRSHRRRTASSASTKRSLGGPGPCGSSCPPSLSSRPAPLRARRRGGEGATPEDLFLRDRLLQLMGIIWVVLFGVGLSVPERRLLTGWGRTSPSTAEVVHGQAGDLDALARAVKDLPPRRHRARPRPVLRRSGPERRWRRHRARAAHPRDPHRRRPAPPPRRRRQPRRPAEDDRPPWLLRAGHAGHAP